MKKITTVNKTISVARPTGDDKILESTEMIAAIEKVRPVFDEDGEWNCAEELFARSDLSKEEIFTMMAYEPILAGRIYQIFLLELPASADFYIRDWRECRNGGKK